MQMPVSLLAEYRAALVEGAGLAPPEEQSLYASHSRELEQIVALASIASGLGQLAALLATERRAFGWSFLSGEHGARVESAFQALAAALKVSHAS